jgi:hypothetical protein
MDALLASRGDIELTDGKPLEQAPPSLTQSVGRAESLGRTQLSPKRSSSTIKKRRSTSTERKRPSSADSRKKTEDNHEQVMKPFYENADYLRKKLATERKRIELKNIEITGLKELLYKSKKQAKAKSKK